jgi:endonuclease/exonuclease/phosphatase family metal-dependent hydrolase
VALGKSKSLAKSTKRAMKKKKPKMNGALAKVMASGRAMRAAGESPALSAMSVVSAPPGSPILALGDEVTIATYNVHRWTGVNGRAAIDPARAGFVISELDADVIALQEVLRPYDKEDPLPALCRALGLHFVFAATRVHKRGEQGNAILSRFPIESCSVLDISHSRIEKRGVLAAQFGGADNSLSVIATHLSLVDRTRSRQVHSLLQHPELNSGPAVLLGDMNAWRKCKATQRLEDQFSRHDNQKWPASFPAPRPVLALDRIYSTNVEIRNVYSHSTPSSRRASDHLPIVAEVRLSS